MDARDRLVAYLLRELPESEQVKIEEEYLTEDAACEQLVVVEDELAYEYLQDRLPPERRRRFEATIGATPRGRQNLEFARSLLQALRASRAREASPGPYWAAAIAAGLALAVLPSWLTFRVAGLSSQLDQLRAESSASQSRLERELASAKQSRSPVEANFVLQPGRTRSGGGPDTLQASTEVDTFRFELVLPPGASVATFVVTFRATDGSQVWSGSVAPSGGKLALQAPARLLAPGEYTVAVRRLSSGEPEDDLAVYSFRLARK